MQASSLSPPLYSLRSSIADHKADGFIAFHLQGIGAHCDSDERYVLYVSSDGAPRYHPPDHVIDRVFAADAVV